MNYTFIRKKYGLKRVELAKIFKVTPESIAKWERGEFKPGGVTKRVYAVMNKLDAENARSLDLPLVLERMGDVEAFELLMREAA